MKSRFILAGIAAVMALTTIAAPVLAQAPEAPRTMTDSHIERIKQNCRSAMRIIQHIHTNDGPLRVNRGQVYDSLSSKLMTPLNSRLTMNKLDASDLVRLTAQYEKTLTDFRESYKTYDNQMARVLTLDCVKQPVRFYDSVAEARQLRGTVHGHVVRLHELIDEYEAAFGTFRTQLREGNAKGGDE